MDAVSLVLYLSSNAVVREAAKVAAKALSDTFRDMSKGTSGKEVREVELDIDSSEVSAAIATKIKELLKVTEQTPSGVLSVSREMVRPSEQPSGNESPEQRELGAIALAISPQAVFSDARQRMGLVFKINLAVAIVLAVILFSGLGGAVYSALFLRNNIWASVFGGVSAADVIGLMIFKPLTAINAALIGTQRLEMIQLRLSQQLQVCAQHKDLQERIECQTVVWDAIQKELALLADTPSPRSKSK